MNNIILNKTEYCEKRVCEGKDAMGMSTNGIKIAAAHKQRITRSGEVSCGWGMTDGLFSKIGNDPEAVLVRYPMSSAVLGCADTLSGSNLGQIEISVRGVALGCVAQERAAAGEFFRSVVNPVLAAA